MECVEWLTHQQSIISQLREEILTQRKTFHENAYKLAKVSEDAYIRELQDTASNQTAEIERLKAIFEKIKSHEMRHYKYETDIYLMASEFEGNKFDKGEC